MPLFHREQAPPNPNRIRVPALVITADAPPRNAPKAGTYARSNVRVLVDAGSGPTQIAGHYPNTPDHWLVSGQEITVLIDPAVPFTYDVDWSVVAPMDVRVAANEPALADPIGATRRMIAALGLTEAETGSSRRDAFTARMRTAQATPSPAGWHRAVVLVTSMCGRLAQGETGGPDLEFDRPSPTVLSVNIPGRPPYAVLTEWMYASGHSDPTRGGVPALVSATDPTDVRVQWAEVPDKNTVQSATMLLGYGVTRQISEAAAAQEARILNARTLPGTAPAGTRVIQFGRPRAPIQPQPPRIEQIRAQPPAVGDLVIEMLQRWVRTIPDPAARQPWIAYYAAAGIDVG